MPRSKRSNTNSIAVLPNKQQCVAAVNYLCNEFYPKYKSNTSNYRVIKELIENNKNSYLWIIRDIINNRTR